MEISKNVTNSKLQKSNNVNKATTNLIKNKRDKVKSQDIKQSNNPDK